MQGSITASCETNYNNQAYTLFMFDSKISKTALWLPELRRIEGVPYAQEVIEALMRESGQEIDMMDPSNTDIILNTALMGRYHMLGHMIAESGIPNLVEPACGFALHGPNHVDADPNNSYLGFDLPDVIKLRNQIINPAQFGANYSTMPGDAFDRETWERVAREFYQKNPADGRVLVVTEGLLRYHPESQQDKLAENIHWLGTQTDGVTWLTDCVLKADTSKSPGCAGYNATAGIADDYCFATHRARNEFMQRHGFNHTIEDWGLVADQIEYAKLHNISPEKIKEIIDLHKGTLIAQAEPR